MAEFRLWLAWCRAADGSWSPITDTRDGFLVERFRSRVERSFEKFEKWTDPITGRAHWRAYGRNGTISVFGLAADNSTRIADPADPDCRTFLWLLEAQYDPHGNAIRLEYKPEDGAEVRPSLSFEGRRIRSGAGFAQRYLKRVRYGNSEPLSVTEPDRPGNEWHFELVFDYGEHGGAVPVADEANIWTVRLDPFSTHQPGFELRTYRLCRRILMFHRFPELGGQPCLVGATELTHSEDETGTVLQSLCYRGYRTDTAGGAMSSRATPELRMRYSGAEIADAFEPMRATDNIPIGIDGAAYQWIDLRNEGLPGVLHRQNQGWYFKENLGGGRFGPTELVDEVPAAVSAAFQLYDHDNDGQINLTSFEGREAGTFVRNRDDGRWGGYQTLRKLPRIDLANARVQWADLNGDGYPDLLIDKGDSIIWYGSDGPDAFADPVEVARPDRHASGAPTLRSSSQLNTFFVDMTGDGRPDMVRIDRGRVEYWPHLGEARFGPGVVMENAPLIDDFGELDPSRLRLVNLEGSGGASLLYIGRGVLRYWINRFGNSFGAENRITNLPYIDSVSSAQIFDFLGDGSQCLVWSSPLPAQRDQAVNYFRLSGALPPRLLRAVANGMGAETRFSYRSSSEDFLRDKRRGEPWRTRIPHHRMVVASVEGQEQVTGTTLVTRYEYHDGYFDNEERKFVGFAAVDTFDTDLSRAGGEAAPEENSPPSLLRTWYQTGEPDRFDERATDFYRGDVSAARLPSPAVDGPAALTTEEQLEAFRTIAGGLWRQELFTLRADGSRSPHPVLSANMPIACGASSRPATSAMRCSRSCKAKCLTTTTTRIRPIRV